MLCKLCGKQIDDASEFCSHCAEKIKNIDIPEAKSTPKDPENQIKTYSPIFWKYFLLVILVNTSWSYWPIGLIATGIYLYCFCRMINEAMSSIGKKNWWPFGLLVLIPLGFWIIFFIIRAQLKPHGKWGKSSGWLIFGVIVLCIAIIGIFSLIQMARIMYNFSK